MQEKNFDIIVTLNPTFLDKRALARYLDAGATIFRLNGSFLLAEGVKDIVSTIRSHCGNQVKLLLDLPGFKPRFSNLDTEIHYEAGIPIAISLKSINYPDIITHCKNGEYLRINDGMVRLRIQSIDNEKVVFIPDQNGVLPRGKGFHLEKRGYRPESRCLSSLDIDLIETAKNSEIDYVGLSFVHNLDDIKHVEKYLEGSSTVFLPKLEARESFEDGNLLSILCTCEKVILDRGDTAGEMGLENIWRIQRKTLDVVNLLGCHVIMATQFFTQMMTSPVPSIAEIDSFFDLVDLGINGVQLSEETCVGSYGFEIVRLIRRNVECLNKYNQNSNAQGSVVWIMGPPSSGKTTIAKSLTERLGRSRIPASHIDGDEIRGLLGSKGSCAPEDRLRVVSMISYHAQKAAGTGDNVVVSALTANKDARDFIQRNIDNLTIVYLNCPMEECARRDPKGLYAKSFEGQIETLIGFNTPYNAPEYRDIVIDTGKCSLDECVQKLIMFLLEEKKIRVWD